MRRHTTEEFVTKAKVLHKEAYSYDRTVYVTAKVPVVIYCNRCHEYFKQRPSMHLTGAGHNKCSNTMTTEEFMEKARKHHGGRYDYSKAKCVAGSKKVTIVCKKHGEFVQRYSNHIFGQGCPKCSNEVERGVPVPSREEIIDKVVAIHGDHYTFDKAEFKYLKTPAIITCKYHGDFVMAPGRLLCKNNGRYRGCPKCGQESAHRKTTSNTEEFITRATKVHGSKYTYKQVEYTKANGKVEIMCPKHGVFLQTPTKHLAGQGCPKCKNITISLCRRASPNGWSYTEWDKAGKQSKYFKGYSLYVIKCSGNGETFYKIGKTFVGLDSRFASDMPYNYNKVLQVYHNAFAISKLEDRLHKKYKAAKYIPTVAFGGMHECFRLTTNDIQNIREELKDYATTYEDYKINKKDEDG